MSSTAETQPTVERRVCFCKYGSCTGYLPNGLKVLQCTATTNITTSQCNTCPKYEQRPEIQLDIKPCCGENKTIDNTPDKNIGDRSQEVEVSVQQTTVDSSGDTTLPPAPVSKSKKRKS